MIREPEKILKKANKAFEEKSYLSAEQLALTAKQTIEGIQHSKLDQFLFVFRQLRAEEMITETKKIIVNIKKLGVDLTESEEMIQKAKRTAQKFDYKNVEFRLGDIENIPAEDNSVDVIISNCVINLSPNKEKVFKEAYRVLKPSGRILISDIVTEGDLPEQVQKSISAWAGCVAGAQEKNQYLATIRNAGFKEVNIVSESNVTIDVSEELKVKIMSVQVEAYKSRQ